MTPPIDNLTQKIEGLEQVFGEVVVIEVSCGAV